MFFNCACWSRTHGYESSAQAYVILGVQLSSVVQEPMFEDMLDADSEWSSVLMSSVLTVMESFLKHLSTETPQQWTWTSTLKRCSDVFYIHFGPLLTSSGRIGIGPWTSQAVILWRILHTKQVWTFIFVNFQSCWKGSLMENLGFHYDLTTSLMYLIFKKSGRDCKGNAWSAWFQMCQDEIRMFANCNLCICGVRLIS